LVVESGSCVAEGSIVFSFRKEILRANVMYKLLCGSPTAQRMGKGWERRELATLK
jgi:hypothetical protein